MSLSYMLINLTYPNTSEIIKIAFYHWEWFAFNSNHRGTFHPATYRDGKIHWEKVTLNCGWHKDNLWKEKKNNKLTQIPTTRWPLIWNFGWRHFVLYAIAHFQPKVKFDFSQQFLQCLLVCLIAFVFQFCYNSSLEHTQSFVFTLQYERKENFIKLCIMTLFACYKKILFCLASLIIVTSLNHNHFSCFSVSFNYKHDHT